MNATEIEKALLQDKNVREVWVGIFAADMLPTKEYPGAYIANTKPSSHSGEHWVAFYTTEPGKLEAFDSYGKNPCEYSEDLKNWIGKDYVIHSSAHCQNYDSTVCGQYCMFFVLLRAKGFSFEDVLSALTKHKGVNDAFVCKFINKYFTVKTIVQDYEFIRQWIINK